MSDGPTKQEAARTRLERAACRYAVVGRMPATEKSRRLYKIAEKRLQRAALAYGDAVSSPKH
jgi:hypothetical protein